MSDTPANTDIVAIRARVYGGGSLLFQSQVSGGVNGFRAVTAASAFTAAVAVNRAPVGAGVLAQCTDGVNTGNLVTANADLLIWDSTHSTYSWIRNQPGAAGTVNTTQPQTLPALGGFFGTIVNYGATDAYRVLAPVKVNISSIEVSTEGATGANEGAFWILGLWFQGSATDALRFMNKNGVSNGGRFTSYLCRFDGPLEVQGEVFLNNCDGVTGASNSSASVSYFIGGQYRGNCFMRSLQGIFDGDVIFDTLYLYSSFSLAGFLCIQTALNVGFAGEGGHKLSTSTLYFGGTAIWGAGTCVVGSQAALLNGSGSTFASNFTLAAGFTLGGQSLGTAYNRTTAGLTGSIATTFANIDSLPAGVTKALFDPPSGATVGIAA